MKKTSSISICCSRTNLDIDPGTCPSDQVKPTGKMRTM